MLVILGGVGFVANRVSQHEIEEIFSARLATSARVLEALLARQLEKATLSEPLVISLPKELEQPDSDDPSPSGHPYESKIAFQVWSDSGVLLAKSASSPQETLGPLARGFHRYSLGQDLWHVFALQSGSVWILTAEKNDVREELSDEIALTILTPLIVGGLILLVVLNLLGVRAIKPVEALATSISKRDPTSLRAIDLPQVPKELEPVVRELNGLLLKVQEAFSREQRFIDCAAHELRTPIAAIQLHVQNALSADDAKERQASLVNAEAASRRATKLAEQLLVYSRLSATVDAERKEALDLGLLCAEVATMMQPFLDSRGQRIECSYPPGMLIHAERINIERLLQNLIENASQYGAAPGTITVRVWQVAQHVELIVENEGNPISDEEKSRIFLPYYRILGTTSFGSGLGLAIVLEIVKQHAGEIKVEDKQAGEGTRITISFPALS